MLTRVKWSTSPGLRQADDGVDQERPAALGGRALRQLLVAPVHRVARLERDDVRVAERREALAHLPRRQAQLAEVDVLRQAQDAQRPRDAARPPPLHLADERVRRVGLAEDALGLAPAVPREDLLDRQHGQDLVLRVAQGDLGAGRRPGRRPARASVTGIGHSVPDARRISSRTRS